MLEWDDSFSAALGHSQINKTKLCFPACASVDPHVNILEQLKKNLQLVLKLFLCRYRKINTLLFCIAFSANCFQTKQQSCVQEVKLSCGGSVCTKKLTKKKKIVSNEMP